MKEPIKVEVDMKVTDGDGKIVAHDTLVRENLSYPNLVFLQGKLGKIAEELQSAAEEKAAGGSKVKR